MRSPDLRCKNMTITKKRLDENRKHVEKSLVDAQNKLAYWQEQVVLNMGALHALSSLHKDYFEPKPPEKKEDNGAGTN